MVVSMTFPYGGNPNISVVVHHLMCKMELYGKTLQYLFYVLLRYLLIFPSIQ